MARKLVFCFLLLSSKAFADYTINHELIYDDRQVPVINLAYNIAKKEGFKNPELLPAIIYKESKAGVHPNYKKAGPKSNPYYGLGQMKVGTAKDTIKKNPELKEIIKNDIIYTMMYDRKAALTIVAKHLIDLGINKNTQKAIMAYNRGLGGVKGNPSQFHYNKDVNQLAAKFKIKK